MTVRTFLVLSRGMLCTIALAVLAVCWHAALSGDTRRHPGPLAQRPALVTGALPTLSGRAPQPMAPASAPARRVALATQGL
ncbi:hypothetical protein QRD43_00050 [Pelomonas sp. APW6]|uniref:Uncharacterized protein n=1 Tax=Roseateles subflavus TaxID=3053353 RepID=A0ABT7LBM2_9BURK|nr:hypothetical protein [Pelomonas sp. APW6]MDL5030277.1 hypothetical protein [Pelomonas sp. APW6]